jgi:hypothetical protein
MKPGLFAPPSRTVRAVIVENRSAVGASRAARMRCSTRLASNSVPSPPSAGCGSPGAGRLARTTGHDRKRARREPAALDHPSERAPTVTVVQQLLGSRRASQSRTVHESARRARGRTEAQRRLGERSPARPSHRSCGRTPRSSRWPQPPRSGRRTRSRSSARAAAAHPALRTQSQPATGGRRPGDRRAARPHPARRRRAVNATELIRHERERRIRVDVCGQLGEPLVPPVSVPLAPIGTFASGPSPAGTSRRRRR